MEINKIYQGDCLEILKTFSNESINCCMTSPPYWALRDYGKEVEVIWNGKDGCEHEWIKGTPAGDSRITKRSENRAGWKRPSREAFASRDIKNICPVCNKEFEGKPDQRFCSLVCLNTLSNEERQNTTQISNFCLKCNAWKGQLGLEPTFDLYIKHLCDIFDEVKRVLRKDGTCWVNIGDTYCSKGETRHKGWGDPKQPKLGIKNYNEPSGLPQIVEEKSLCNIPARFSIEMQNRGWILRNIIIWHKNNCMPSSVKDRFTVDFEYLFFFTKSKKYFFETQYESYAESSDVRYRQALRAGRSYAVKSPYKNNPPYSRKFQNISKEESEKFSSPRARYKRGQGSVASRGNDADGLLVGGHNPKGRNKRCVWKIPTKPFSEAHFAIYPEEFCETPIKAGCPPGGIVLDPFFGAGTTGVVALKQNKKFIGIELNPEYIEIAQNRIKPYLEQQKLI